MMDQTTVDLVVTGSIQQTGDRLRVTLNVVDPLTLRIVSAETLDATTQDASLLQDEVVLRVARLLGLDVGPAARTLVSAGGTSAPGAYEYYLQGRAYLQRPERPENVDAALSLFERALALDVKFALAHAALAEASWRKYEGTRLHRDRSGPGGRRNGHRVEPDPRTGTHHARHRRRGNGTL